jgi:anti-sigma regulatory factor (Ser/Thr protein kinase)
MHHGNLELDSELRQGDGKAYEALMQERLKQEPYRSRKLYVHLKLTRDEARFVLRDEGPGFDVSKLPDPTDPENLLKPSGRGILLMRLFLDEVRHNEVGNEITLAFRRKARRAG